MSFSFDFSRESLSKPVDNTPLVLFRIMFGFLVFMEGVSFFFLGQIDEIYYSAPIVFNYYGLEWLQPLPWPGMYGVFAAICVVGLMIMAGWRYRWSAWSFALLWTYVYFSHKEHYNNHHYLFMLMAYVMAVMPAAADVSVDVHQRPEKRQTTCPQWCISFFIVQLLIVYTYASIAKLYPDWLAAIPIEIWMKGKAHYWLIGDWLQPRWVHYALSYGGILFDGFVIWLLLYKNTRWSGVALSICFHLFNSFVFQIGIFPYLMLGTLFFFFEGEDLRRVFLKRWKWSAKVEARPYTLPSLGYALLGGYFVIQLLLPLRHWLFEGNVHWNDEGHKLSWHMMLRSKSGSAVYRVTNLETGEVVKVRPSQMLNSSKSRLASTQPDAMRQFARFLKLEYEEKGWKQVAVYVDCVVSLNGRTFTKFIDPSVDLSTVPWEVFSHAEWVLPLEEDSNDKKAEARQ